ncbi:MFS transporter [Glycomyces terrestris]|uniref:MFS transporter n=1 Tax=Glycomyces terrestris TaxID=2493553 RepID=A0A426V3F6_9ACTN|nr:MFS transporter [Glycomyces terrestris]RRS01396.1 MFS transporter [Glycomyces terrestris]
MTALRQDTAPPSEARLWAELWPLLLASAVSLLPFTVYSTFLVPIARDAGGDVAAVGALRGLGGITALAVGVTAAPLLERFAKRRVGAVALGILAAGSLTALHGSFPALVVFCAAIGSSTALLTPALLAAAADRYDDAATSGRAATLVSATQALAAVAAGPVIGVVAAQTGWRGALVMTAALATVLAIGFALRPDPHRHTGGSERPPGYRDAFRQIAGRRILLALISAASFRTAALMGCLAYMAAWYDHAFGLDAALFTLVWTVSGLSFFLGNYFGGRWIGRTEDPHQVALALLGGVLAATAGLVLLFAAPSLVPAIAGTALQSAGHAVTAAAITALIVRRGGPVRSAALSVNAAGMSLGTFAGASLGGAGLALFGYPGIAGALVLPLLAATAIAVAIWRAVSPSRSADPAS